MDVNTTIVVIVDGGLIIFFLYALYTILSPNLATRGIKKDLKSLTQEPVFPQMHRFSEEELEPQESIPQEEYEAEPAEPAPIEYEPPEYEAEPAEPAPIEYEPPEYEAEPAEPAPIEYEPPEYEAEPVEPQESIPQEECEAELLDYQAREEELSRIKRHERKQ